MNTGKTIPSSSDAFLNRIERQRLESECLRALDLRPTVKGTCHHYSYRGRSLWLDKAAHRLFLEGLRKNAGVFTVETYESILALSCGTNHKKDNVGQNVHRLPVSDTRDRLSAGTTRISNNLTLDLSYFEMRIYDRFKVVLDMALISDENRFPAETRDISVSGMQLRVKGLVDIRQGDLVQIDVSPSTERVLESPELDYRVVRIRRLLNETLLALQCAESEPKDGLVVVADHLSRSAEQAKSRQSEPEDALLTAQAQLAERFYMRSTTTVPFFIFKDQDSASTFPIVFSNPINRQALQAFEISPGKYDFQSLLTPKRLKLFQRLALRDSKADTLIAVHRSPHDKTPQVRADLDCKNHKHWCRLLLRYSNQPGFRVFKIVARNARYPVTMRIEDAIGPLANQDEAHLRKLLLDADSLAIVGALIDVTEQIRGWHLGACNPDHYAPDEPIVCNENQQPLPPPKLIPIHYIQDNRSESRYLSRMEVEICIADKIFIGETRDISVHGLSVVLPNPDRFIEHNQSATVTFPKLDAHSSGMARIQRTFRYVPVVIVGIKSDKKQHLRLRISDSPKGHQFAHAFSNILLKLQSDLRIETSHTLRAVTSRLYSSIFVESSPTLPAFIYRQPSNNWAFRLGLVSSPSPVIDFFEVADGRFDFDALISNGRLEKLMRDVTDYGSGSITIYLCKERQNDSPTFSIKSMADFEIFDNASRRSFVLYALKHVFCCVKIVASLPDIPPQAEIEQAIDRLTRLSPGKSERLKIEFSRLIAIGDVVDITGLVEDTWFETDSV